MHSRKIGWLMLGLFFCSGGTALVYEVVWSKFLSQMFGSTIYAQTVVLAAFMGGLALGNKLLGRWADRAAQTVVLAAFWKLPSASTRFYFPRSTSWLENFSSASALEFSTRRCCCLRGKVC